MKSRNPMSLRHVKLHGHDVRYRMAGEGPAVVLIHGMAGSSRTWRDVMPLLTPKYTVIAPDLLGHGESAKPLGDYSLGAYASGLRDLLVGALGIERATLVGQSLGAKKPERAEEAVRVATKYDVAFMTAIGLVFFVWAYPIVGLFTEDAAATAIAVTGLRTMALGFPLFGAGMVLEQAFNGAGDTWTPTWINLFVYWVIQIPLAWVLAYPLGVGVHGVFISVTVAYCVFVVVAYFLFRRGRWKEKHV